MAKCVFESCCGCIGLHAGTKTLGIIVAILKLGRLVEQSFLMFMSLFLHALAGRLSALTETMFAMPGISFVVVALQFVFTIVFLVRLFKNNNDNMKRLYITNAVCFAIECVAMAIFLIILIWDDEGSTETKIWIGFLVGDVSAAVLNLYFILLLRSCLAKGDLDGEEAPPLPMKNKEIITIPFKRL